MGKPKINTKIIEINFLLFIFGLYLKIRKLIIEYKNPVIIKINKMLIG